MTQMISCEYTVSEYGWSLEHIDCEFERCVHSKDCDVVKKALAKEAELSTEAYIRKGLMMLAQRKGV